MATDDPPPTSGHRPTSGPAQSGGRKSRHVGVFLFFCGLFAALALGSLPFIVAYLSNQNAAYTDVVFPLLLVAGVCTLVLVIAVLVGIFQLLDLTDRRYALGLPNGSISAIIALMLILVFAMLSVLVQINMDPSIRTIRDLTQSQVDQLPASEIIYKECSAEGRCLVDRLVPRSAATVDIGKQLVTTVSTLVVAISAFYFGSVQTASVASKLRRTDDDSEPG